VIASLADPDRRTYLRDLLYELVGRDVKLRYRRSVLGILWSLVNPLVQLLVFVFLFRRVVPLDIPNYPLFAFTGVLAWSWFASALPAATISITSNRELIRQPGFPAPILPVVPVLSNLIHFSIALGLLLVVLLATGGSLGFAVLGLPLVIALQFMLTVSLAYFTATLEVRFRDTSHVLRVLLLLGLFLTPVFYQVSAVPPRYQLIYLLNPMVHLITAYREVLIHGRWPEASTLIVLGAAVALMSWLGHRIFTRASVAFAEEL
jgi:lipopolysaccharide transport system permease protein